MGAGFQRESNARGRSWASTRQDCEDTTCEFFWEDLITDESGVVDRQLSVLVKVPSLPENLRLSGSYELVEQLWTQFSLTSSCIISENCWSPNQVVVSIRIFYVKSTSRFREITYWFRIFIADFRCQSILLNKVFPRILSRMAKAYGHINLEYEEGSDGTLLDKAENAEIFGGGNANATETSFQFFFVSTPYHISSRTDHQLRRTDKIQTLELQTLKNLQLEWFIQITNLIKLILEKQTRAKYWQQKMPQNSKEVIIFRHWKVELFIEKQLL